MCVECVNIDCQRTADDISRFLFLHLWGSGAPQSGRVDVCVSMCRRKRKCLFEGLSQSVIQVTFPLTVCTKVSFYESVIRVMRDICLVRVGDLVCFFSVLRSRSL